MTKTVYDPNTSSSNRRGFLRGLASLPLIGGGIALIGNPTQAAEPVTDEMLRRYANWCGAEFRETWAEIHALSLSRKHPGIPRDVFMRNADDTIALMGLRPEPAVKAALPSTRAAVVLSAAGCRWQSDCQ